MYTTIVDGIIPARSAAAASSGEKELWAARKASMSGTSHVLATWFAAIDGDVAGPVRRDRRHRGDHLFLELQPLLDIVDRRGDDDLGHDESPFGTPAGSGGEYRETQEIVRTVPFPVESSLATPARAAVQ